MTVGYSIADFHQCRLEFGEHLSADRLFSCEGVMQIGGVNSGQGGEFPMADFFAGLIGSRNDCEAFAHRR
jgi:hypothetical protein